MSRAVPFVAALVAVAAISSVALADAFSEAEGRHELTAARIRAAQCSKVSGVQGPGKLKVSIGNDGHVSEIVMVSVPPKMDEPTDACIRAEFMKVRVTPFEGMTAVVSGGFMLL